MVAAMTQGPKSLDSPAPLSPVFGRAEAVRPSVRQPSSPWTLVLGMTGTSLLGLVAFTSLSSAREARAQNTVPPVVAQAAEPRQMLPDPPPPPPPVQLAAPVGLPLMAADRADAAEAHWRAPTVIVDLSEAGAAPSPQRLAQLETVAPGAATTAPQDTGSSAEERFAARVTGSTVDTARATQMRDLGRTVPQGFVIPAVLETALDSDLPGSVRAVVSRDIRGFDGAQVLVPRGSHLIGQYRSAAAVGQTRAFVVWSRIITPTGVTIDVGSPATDRLGRGGLEGKADSHFFQRFGAAILLSVVSGAVDALSRNSGDSTSLVIGSSGQAQNVAAIALQKQIDIPTTIRVPQGAAVQVFVSRDLDFSRVP